jgi:hypothetical protein
VETTGAERLGVFAPESMAAVRRSAREDIPVTEGKAAAFGGAVGPAIMDAPVMLAGNTPGVQAGLGAITGAGKARLDAADARRAGQQISGTQEALGALGYAAVHGGAGYIQGRAMGAIGGIPNAPLRVGANAGVGAATGAGEQAAENLIAKYTVDPNRTIGQDVGRAALAGGVQQGLFSGLHEALRGYYQRRAAAARTPEERDQVHAEARDVGGDTQQPPPGAARPQPEPEPQARQEQAAPDPEEYRRRSEEARRERQQQRNAPGMDEAGARETLGIDPKADVYAEDVVGAFRKAVKSAHPDAGGTPEQMQRVVEAREFMDRLYGGKRRPQPPPPPSEPQEKQANPSEPGPEFKPSPPPQEQPRPQAAASPPADPWDTLSPQPKAPAPTPAPRRPGGEYVPLGSNKATEGSRPLLIAARFPDGRVVADPAALHHADLMERRPAARVSRPKGWSWVLPATPTAISSRARRRPGT